jgi:hypothetical protein
MTILEASSYSRNCYIIHSLQDGSKDSSQTISALTDERKDQLLMKALQRTNSLQTQTEAILKQLESWNPSLAQYFEPKKAPFSTSPLRMLHSSWEKIEKDGQRLTSSFVALSYCWRSPEWLPIAKAYKPPQSQEVPISKCLWDFLLGLLDGDEEAIWIDQLCLDQSDRLEKISAVASMDALYACARLVFVALDDVRLDYREVSILLDAFRRVAEDQEWGFSNEMAYDLFAVVAKIFSARWFSRAWCFHEYHLNHDRIIAIPCEAEKGELDTAIGLVNLGEFILRLTYFQKDEIRSQNADLIHRLMSFFGGQDYAYSNIIANTFSYNSKYSMDKLTITLNICQLGITIKDSTTDFEEAQLNLLILALAAGDATILTTRGPKLEFGSLPRKRSWLQWPDETTWSQKHAFPLPSGIYSITPEQITLDLLFFPDRNFRGPSYRAIARAKKFLKSARANQIRIAYGLQGRDAPYEQDRGTIDTLACALECGFAWMVKAWYRIRSEVAAEVEQSFEAIEDLAMTCIQGLFGRSPRRCVWRSVRRPLRRICFTRGRIYSEPQTLLDRLVLNLSSPKVSQNSKLRITGAFEFLVCIILFGRYWEMSTCVTTTADSSSRAICDLKLQRKSFRIPAPAEHKLYSDAKYTYHSKKKTFLAVPKVLTGRVFALSDRLWLLEAATDKDGSCWRVREKVCLLGCPSIRCDGRTVILKENQRVIG